MPTVVAEPRCDSSLLLLGFLRESRTFAVFLRLVVSMPGTPSLRQYTHVGVQFDPDEAGFADVRSAPVRLAVPRKAGVVVGAPRQVAGRGSLWAPSSTPGIF